MKEKGKENVPTVLKCDTSAKNLSLGWSCIGPPKPKCHFSFKLCDPFLQQGI